MNESWLTHDRLESRSYASSAISGLRRGLTSLSGPNLVPSGAPRRRQTPYRGRL